MRLSIFTPVHPPIVKYLAAAHESLAQQQTYVKWEWVLVPNQGSQIPASIAADERVRIYPYPNQGTAVNVGELKRFACEHCTGDVLVELDGDDLLTPQALRSVAAAFQNSQTMFAYSNSAEFNEKWESNVYGERYGWRTRPYQHGEHDLVEMIAWPAGPQMMRHVYWAPNHVRAWRKTAYDALGGHDPKLLVGDDHDLLCRTYVTYGAQGMAHIDECLYLYRQHGNNSYKRFNAKVQAQTWSNYHRYALPMAVRWARDNHLRCLDLGGRINGQPGLETVDLHDADVTADLTTHRWPFDDSSAGVVRANHIFEHLPDPVHTMNELYRILAPGGWAFIEVPSTDGRGAFQDPTHRSFWNENSFWYYTRRSHAQYIRPTFNGRFQQAYLQTLTPAWGQEGNIVVTRAHLIALKPPYDERPVGEVWL